MRGSAHRSGRGASGLLAALLVALGGACASVPQQSSLMKATDTEVGRDELRAVDKALVISVPGIIETSSDEIMAKTTDPEMRSKALHWKMDAVPAFYLALFQTDPLAAGIDAWVLSIQVEEYLKTGPGRDRFGTLQPIAIQAAEQARATIADQLRAVAKKPEGFQNAQTKIEAWAHENPINGPLSSRPSILLLLAQMAGPGDSNVFGAVGDITATVGDIATRLDVYSSYILKAGRWQGELLIDDMALRDDAHQTLATFRSVKALADRLDALATPQSIQEATSFAVAAFRTERVAAMSSIDKMRVESFTYLSGEREIALASVNKERAEVMADIDRQRTLALQQVDDLRKQTFTDVDRLASRVIWRTALAAAVLLLLAAALAYGVLTAVSRKRASPPDLSKTRA